MPEINAKATLAALMSVPGELAVRRREGPQPHVEIAVADRDGEDSLSLFPDGYAVICVSWGSMGFWDRWEGHPDESLKYTGTVGDEHRQLPAWVVFEEGGEG